MLFLNPLLLWGVLAASVPIIIHLLNRRRHRTIQWAAMQFLLKATRESRGKKKLRHLLILTCRALGIVALAFAASRPLVSGLLGWGSGTVDTVVLVLDRSASMEARPGDGLGTRRELILEQFQQTIAELGPTRTVLIDSASGEPQELPSPDVITQISATGATDTAADMPALLARAAEFLGESGGRAEIWMASDLQAANWRPDDDRWAAGRASLAALPQKPALRILSLTGPTAANVSIRLLQSRRTGDDLVLDLELLRSDESRGSASIPLTTSLDGTRTTEVLTLPGQSLRFQKAIPIPPGSESGFGHLSIPADGNARDNAAFFAYGPARPVKSLVVAPPGETADYLALAAAPPGFGNSVAERIDPSQAAQLATADAAAILWAAPLPTGPAAEALLNFINSGGHVLFVPPGTESSDEFLGMRWSAPTEAEIGKFFILNDWSRTDGPLADGMDSVPIPADRLRAIRRQIPLGDAAALARWEDDEPFLVRRVADRGTAWFMGSRSEYTWSNLGDADVLLPVVQRIVAAGSERFDASYVTHVGSDMARPLPGEVRQRVDDHGTPDPANAAFEAGVYRFGDRLIAVNRPAEEDSPEIISRDGLDTALDGTGYTLLDQAGQAADPTLARDVWRAFLFAVLFFLISEALLCLPKKSTTEVFPTPKPA